MISSLQLSLSIVLVLGVLGCNCMPQKDVLSNEIPSAIHVKHLNSNGNHLTPKKEDTINRKEFITGHRIPLELFSKETLKRIELTNTNEDEINLNGRQYVDSSDFRSGIVRSQEEFSPESLLDILGEIDPTYEGTLDSFSPKVFAK